MTKSTFGRAKELSRHLLRATLEMTTKKWILGTGAIALLYLGWTALRLVTVRLE